MIHGIKYFFKAKVWVHSSEGGWHFLSMPHEISKEIRDNLKGQEEGWGRMKATAQIEDCSWETSIWFDTKIGTYILPVKAEIRKKKNIRVDDLVEVLIQV